MLSRLWGTMGFVCTHPINSSCNRNPIFTSLFPQWNTTDYISTRKQCLHCFEIICNKFWSRFKRSHVKNNQIRMSPQLYTVCISSETASHHHKLLGLSVLLHFTQWIALHTLSPSNFILEFNSVFLLLGYNNSCLWSTTNWIHGKAFPLVDMGNRFPETFNVYCGCLRV